MTRTATARPTLAASRKAKDEVAKRQLNTILQGLRSKIEGNPQRYGGLVSRLDRAERATFEGHLVQARDQIIEIERILDEKDEAARTAEQQAEQARLAEARDQPTATADSGVSTRDGWLWLLSKGRYTGGRKEAGRVFRDKFSKAQPSLKSCIAGSAAGAADASAGGGEQSHARFELDGVRKHIISSVGSASGEALYSLLVEVVGKGETVRSLVDGNDRKADAKVVELGLALDLAGVYLGAVRT